MLFIIQDVFALYTFIPFTPNVFITYVMYLSMCINFDAVLLMFRGVCTSSLIPIIDEKGVSH